MIDPLHNPEHFQNPKRQTFTIEILRGSIQEPVLDVGESPFLDRIRRDLNVEIACTSHDLDVGRIEGQWSTILCFEVLEHLGSPLRLLQQMRSCLDPAGSIWLSMPVISKWRPDAFRASNHVFEFTQEQLVFLFNKAGLVVEQEYSILYRPWWQYFRGVRPVIRLMTDRCRIVRLALH